MLSQLVSRPVAQSWDGKMIYDVTDLGKPPGNGVRPDVTNAEQNFHTDNSYNLCAPDYVALLCLRPAKEGGISSIVSFHTVYNEMLAQAPAAGRPPVRALPVRPQQGTRARGAAGDQPPPDAGGERAPHEPAVAPPRGQRLPDGRRRARPAGRGCAGDPGGDHEPAAPDPRVLLRARARSRSSTTAASAIAAPATPTSPRPTRSATWCACGCAPRDAASTTGNRPTPISAVGLGVPKYGTVDPLS